MKYFTPELFVAFNSPDRKIARAASIQWDKAVTAYDKHLRSIRRKLPRSVRQLSKLYLHDAELLEFEDASPNGRKPVAHLVLRQHGDVVFLSYFLLEKPSISKPIQHAIFSSRAVQWLYDEIECQGPGAFCHDILFSDGTVFHLRFEHLSILSAGMSAPQLIAGRGTKSECV